MPFYHYDPWYYCTWEGSTELNEMIFDQLSLEDQMDSVIFCYRLFALNHPHRIDEIAPGFHHCLQDIKLPS